jgi:pilus assembly protein Flp/PilA
MLNRFLRDDHGAIAMEYALLAVLIGIALVATFTLLGDTVANMFGSGSDGAVAVIDQQTSQL